MGILGGAATGAFAAMAMTGLRQVTTGLGLVQRTPPDAAMQEAAPGLLARLAPGHRQAAVEVAHWAYGAAGGALYGLLPERARSSAVIGLAYGAGSWVVFEQALAPRIGQAHEGGGRQHAALLVDHLLYGTALARLAR
jgi:hypothetical protein